MTMNVHILDDENQIGKVVAQMVAAQIYRNPFSVLGLATGSTPLPTYQELIKLYEQGLVSFDAVTTFNLDEYVGLDREHEQSYYRFMLDNLFSQIDIDLSETQIPNPLSENLEDDCFAYEVAIEAEGGIDLQLLGIGSNGHIAFNEPSDVFTTATHIVELSQSTVEDNKRFFSNIDEVPTKAITMGIGTIMSAREIILIATGENKAQAVRDMINGPIDPRCPASILQLHPATTVFLDPAAASLIIEEDSKLF